MIMHKFPSRDVRPEGGLQASGMDLGLGPRPLSGIIPGVGIGDRVSPGM